jgi:hypothetical protein
VIEVVIHKQSANDVLNIVYDLVAHGLVRDVDFEFAYHAAEYDNWSGDVTYNKHTVFRFKDAATASWFTLKYDK